MTTDIETRNCPSCGKGSKGVKKITLQALLNPEAKTRFTESPYRFCSSANCDVVYFTEDWSSIFNKDELSVRVGIKETTPPRPVCYCFDHTIEEIEDDFRQNGKTTVLDDIKTQMKKACWCETKSPMGSCCLGTVTKHVKAAEAKYGPGNVAILPDTNEQEDCCAHK